MIHDTICAIATPNGVGALGIIRLSGPKSIAIVNACFSKNIQNAKTHTIHFGTIKNQSNEIIDEVLVSIFEQGKSFTGEESIEISCHGSSFILQQIIQLLTYSGCRLANPGEFTQRAFLNGKLDLSQAEAVSDLIASQTANAHHIALKQLRGNFSNELQLMRQDLIHFASLVELELDFAEEDVEFADRTELLALVNHVIDKLKTLANSFELGNAIKNGVPVAIVGAPNTGKSTLLNQLLGEERAIVSDIAGTTRDVIEETLNIEGILFRLIDTAGIRENAETIEALGIERSKQKIEQAQIVLCLADGSSSESLAHVRNWRIELLNTFPTKKIVILVNKIDQASPTLANSEIGISAKLGTNLAELKTWMVAQITAGFDLQNDTIVSNARHLDALNKTIDSLQTAKLNLESNITGDFVAMDIRQAMYWLGTITGQISEDDLLANIFSKFCIGK